MNAPMIWPGVMTRSMACPPTCGAAAAVLVSESFANAKGLDKRVHIAAQALRGTAEARQVEGARTALQHNLGLGGACIVTMYSAG